MPIRVAHSGLSCCCRAYADFAGLTASLDQSNNDRAHGGRALNKQYPSQTDSFYLSHQRHAAYPFAHLGDGLDGLLEHIHPMCVNVPFHEGLPAGMTANATLGITALVGWQLCVHNTWGIRVKLTRPTNRHETHARVCTRL